MTRRGISGRFLAALAAVWVGGPCGGIAGTDDGVARFVGLFCVECHNADDRAGGIALDGPGDADPAGRPEVWEKVVRKLEARQMPPADSIRPKERAYEAALDAVTGALDRAAVQHPDPGRTSTFRRLTRAEYQNAVRDLLDLEIDAASLLPADESSHGFDNLTVADLSPTRLDRYLTAAQRVSRLAVGGAGRSPGGETFRLPADLTQEEHVEGLPVGTRGGALIRVTFPRDGEYEVTVRLARDRNEHVEGLREPHDMVVLLDRAKVAGFTVKPPRSEGEHQTADALLTARVRATAGPHGLGVTFVKQGASLLETKRQPYQAHYNMHRHPRLSPAVFQVTVTGPYVDAGPGDTPSRRRVFAVRPKGPGDEDASARANLAALARRAYRRPVTDDELRRPMDLYRQAKAESGYEAGVEAGLAGLLVSPHFLFRIETDPPGTSAGQVYPVPDLALASRLSFFLWSSIPDDELLGLAERGELSRPEVYETQVRRLLADPRSQSLVTNFAAQWLQLRNLDSVTPDLRLFPDFDDNLRQALRGETERLFGRVVREDRSVLDLIRPGPTELNERLAKHYGVPHVYGSRFRPVEGEEAGGRGGLLRQGSVLTVTSYATRTSPVVRGKWVLETLLGTPPPPPPANVPALKDNTVAASLSVRERLAEHRKNVACAGCHRLMDPVGFALENYDAVGRRRDTEEGRAVDATGGLPDGSEFVGVEGLEKALLKRPGRFVGSLAEALLTYALGRVTGPSDGPALRRVVRDARARGDRFSEVVLGVCRSEPFRLRRSE